MAHQYHNGKRISIPTLQFDNEISNFIQQNMKKKSNVRQVSSPTEFQRQLKVATILKDNMTQLEANDEAPKKNRLVPSILKKNLKEPVQRI